MNLCKMILACFILYQLIACASSSPIRTEVKAAPSVRSQPASVRKVVTATGSSVVNTARSMLGAPYRYGGTTPKGFDCSGLVSYVYRQAGIRIPRTSSDQYRQARKVSLQRLQPGDLLFFRLSPPKVSHVGIYEGSGRFIHAASSGKRVAYATLENPYWREHLIGAGRFQ